jgi:hypothetical protein
MIGKEFAFPLWLETLAIVAIAVMAFVEARHEQWLWAVIFGLGAVAFIASAIARAFSGENNGRP